MAEEIVLKFADSWTKVEQESLDILKNLLRMDTQNFGENGSETVAAKYLKGLFDDAGIECSEILEPKPGRGNVVARVRGDGSSGLGPILLSAHLDTVHAPRENWEREGWKHDPFGAVVDEEDGCLYGRGAIDMKNMAAMSASVLMFVQRNKIQLGRDLVFAGVADEERHGSQYGSKFLVKDHPDLIEADVVLTEVGAFSNYLDGKEFFPVQFAEKGAFLVRVVARGPGGHGSVYHKTNPVVSIGQACVSLAANRLPHHVTDAARYSIDKISELLPWYKATVFRQLLSPTLGPWVMRQVLKEEQQNVFGPMLHNTANPTIVAGGDQVNQIPSEASVVVDCRVLPGMSESVVEQELKAAIGVEKFSGDNPELCLEFVQKGDGFAQDPSELGISDVLERLGKVVSKNSGGRPIVPYMLIGRTDQAQYICHPKRRPVCLGFSPVRIPEGMAFPALFHGVNERIPVDGYKWGLKVLTESALDLCSARLS